MTRHEQMHALVQEFTAHGDLEMLLACLKRADPEGFADTLKFVRSLRPGGGT